EREDEGAARKGRPEAVHAVDSVAGSGSGGGVTAARLPSGCPHASLPDAWNETLRPCPILLVVVPKRLPHHSLLGAKAEGDEEGHRDTVGGACNPVGNHEGLAQ